MKKATIPFIITSILSHLSAAPLSDELVVLHNATTVEMNAIASPIDGSLIFNTDNNEVYERNATAWNRISSNGSETKIIAGNGVIITGSGTAANPYLINVQAPVINCLNGAQASSCSAISMSSNGTYCIDHDDAGPSTPYLVYCDMNTDTGGWSRVVRTTSNNQQFGQENDSIAYAPVTSDTGIYETYTKMKNFSKVMIKKVGTADFASYNLVSAVAGESIHDLMTFVKNQPMQVQNDTAFDGTRVKGLTSEYSGTKVAGTLNYNYFFMAGINESFDNDQAYMSFSDSTGSINTWGDNWRGVNQAGTLWSFLNGDYYTSTNYHIGNGYSQAGAGYKGNNNGTYEIYIK
jgi:hypothetical protein